MDADHKISIRPVKVGDHTGPMWIIENGLKPGDTVVAEGIQKIRPGVASAIEMSFSRSRGIP